LTTQEYVNALRSRLCFVTLLEISFPGKLAGATIEFFPSMAQWKQGIDNLREAVRG
jgi:hypothetical protein